MRHPVFGHLAFMQKPRDITPISQTVDEMIRLMREDPKALDQAWKEAAGLPFPQVPPVTPGESR